MIHKIGLTKSYENLNLCNKMKKKVNWIVTLSKHPEVPMSLFITVEQAYHILLGVARQSTTQRTCYFSKSRSIPISSPAWNGASESKVPCPLMHSTRNLKFWGHRGIQPTLSSLTKDCPDPDKYPNPNVRKQDLNSSLVGLYFANFQPSREFITNRISELLPQKKAYYLKNTVLLSHFDIPLTLI